MLTAYNEKKGGVMGMFSKMVQWLRMQLEIGGVWMGVEEIRLGLNDEQAARLVEECAEKEKAIRAKYENQ